MNTDNSTLSRHQRLALQYNTGLIETNSSSGLTNHLIKDLRVVKSEGKSLKDHSQFKKKGVPGKAKKNAIERDGVDPSILEFDNERSFNSQILAIKIHDSPILKDDTSGRHEGAVKNTTERDGVDLTLIDSVLTSDHTDLSASSQLIWKTINGNIRVPGPGPAVSAMMARKKRNMAIGMPYESSLEAVTGAKEEKEDGRPKTVPAAVKDEMLKKKQVAGSTESVSKPRAALFTEETIAKKGSFGGDDSAALNAQEISKKKQLADTHSSDTKIKIPAAVMFELLKMKQGVTVNINPISGYSAALMEELMKKRNNCSEPCKKFGAIAEPKKSSVTSASTGTLNHEANENVDPKSGAVAAVMEEVAKTISGGKPGTKALA